MQHDQNMTNWRRVARALVDSSQDATPDCAACRAHLAAYLEAELAGRNGGEEYPAVAVHLPSCTECQEAYNDLRHVLQLERSGLLPEPPVVANLDFSYLKNLRRAPTKLPLWEHIQEGGQQMQRLIGEIRLRLGQVAATFEALPGMLAPQTLPAAATRQQPRATGNLTQLLTVPTGDEEVALGLIVGPAAQQATTLGVQITIGIDARPLSRVRVSVRDDARRLLASEMTTERGQVFFEDVGQGTYLIQVRYGEKVWELPLVLVAEASPAP